jgi:hypothetical protein
MPFRVAKPKTSPALAFASVSSVFKEQPTPECRARRSHGGESVGALHSFQGLLPTEASFHAIGRKLERQPRLSRFFPSGPAITGRPQNFERRGTLPPPTRSRAGASCVPRHTSHSACADPDTATSDQPTLCMRRPRHRHDHENADQERTARWRCFFPRCTRAKRPSMNARAASAAATNSPLTRIPPWPI